MRFDEIAGGGRVLILAAHPDDEVIGAGAQFPLIGARLTIAHVTRGAPRSQPDGEVCALARYEESLTAAAHAGIAHSQFHQLDFVDQEAALNLEALSNAVASLINELAPDIVLTHPYEGGHPDHDAAAFAAHAAVAAAGRKPALWEFTSYHAGGPSGMITGQFLPSKEKIFSCRLSADKRKLKRLMLDTFVTQQQMIQNFSADTERFRIAPSYDFLQPPHAGRLFYENYAWGMTGGRFRELASQALHAADHS